VTSSPSLPRTCVIAEWTLGYPYGGCDSTFAHCKLSHVLARYSINLIPQHINPLILPHHNHHTRKAHRRDRRSTAQNTQIAQYTRNSGNGFAAMAWRERSLISRRPCPFSTGTIGSKRHPPQSPTIPIPVLRRCCEMARIKQLIQQLGEESYQLAREASGSIS
jgi:hypothetical protein